MKRSKSGTRSCASCREPERADQVDAFLDAGAEGAVVSIPDEASLRDFAERYR